MFFDIMLNRKSSKKQCNFPLRVENWMKVYFVHAKRPIDPCVKLKNY